MVQKGFSNESGPIAVMLHDHAEGCNFLKSMSENISRFKSGDDHALKAIYSNMLGYADLLKNHIGKENNVLFRMADNAFSPAEQESLLLDFTKVEARQENVHSKADYIAMINLLSGLYIERI
jgi:hemerythrin-like domain-containing protein